MSFKYTVKQGDTLNKIANQYGFRNYKDAGVASVPSGNFDLIRVGDQIDLGNYDPNAVKTNEASAPFVVSSLDNAQLFNENKSALDELMAKQDEANAKKDAQSAYQAELEAKYKSTQDTNNTAEVKYNSPDEKLFAMSREDDQAKQDQATARMEQDRADYLASLNTRLADIDSVAQASIQRIEASSARRIAEQQRINSINTDRVRAYGLGGAQYKPIMYSDAVTERERKGADIIQQYERERDTAINQALESARAGKSALLADKMKALNDIEDRMRTKLQEIETESDKQYQLLRNMRDTEEKKRLALVEEQTKKLQAYIQLNKDEYEGLDANALEAKIYEDMRITGLGFSEVFNTIQTATAVDYKNEQEKLKAEKLQAEIETEKQQAKTQISMQVENYAQAEKARRTDEGSDFSTAQKQKLEQAGLSSAPRQQQLDYLYMDSDEYEYKYSNKGASGSLRDRVRQAGYDYDAMKAQGYSDDEIEKALSG